VNDNRPFFPVDKQEVEVTVREEQVGIAVGTFNYAQDLDERQLFCYSIIGMINNILSVFTIYLIILKVFNNKLAYKNTIII